MSNFIKKAFIASTILLSTSPALARYDSGFFGRVDLGYGISQKFGTTASSAIGPYSGVAMKNSNKSSTYGAALGFHYSSEIAFELAYWSFPKAKTTVFGTSSKYELTSHALMGNITYYIDAGFVFRPFFSIGMGFGKSRLQYTAGANPQAHSQASTSYKRMGAAYQLGAGASFPISNDISFEARYRYHYISGKPGGVAVGQRTFGHSALISAKISF